MQFLILIFIGAMFTFVGAMVFSSSKVNESWVRVPGRVVEVSHRISDGSNLYTPVVQYESKGKTYKIGGSVSTSVRPSIGDERTVAYNPVNPSEAKVVEGFGMQLLFLLFPAIGVLMLVFAPILFTKTLLRSRRIKKLVQSGQKLEGVLVDIQSYGGNNGYYKIVVAAIDSTGTAKNYMSDALSGAAGLTMANFRNDPIAIDVYVDSANPNNYYVDISDIPSLTPEKVMELVQTAKSKLQPQSFASKEKADEPLPDKSVA